VIVEAQALRALEHDDLLQALPRRITYLLALLTACVWLGSNRPMKATLYALLVLAGGLVLLVFAQRTGHVIAVAMPMAIGVLASSGRLLMEGIRSVGHRRRLRGAFSGYVSPGVMGEILAGRLTADADGEMRYVCVMFSDIRGYTARSEGRPPHEVLSFLNRYFERLVEIIHRHGGTVVSFMGDGIMVVFGAPQPLEDPCRSALRATLEMFDNLAALNRELAGEGAPAIDIGIGLHAGEAVLGHVGARERHDYTAIGDVTNVAARLEGLTKEAGYRLLCSDVVAEHADGIALAPLGPLKMKGHSAVGAFGYAPVSPPSPTLPA
jgi:class 3 adenylate cyclase